MQIISINKKSKIFYSILFVIGIIFMCLAILFFNKSYAYFAGIEEEEVFKDVIVGSDDLSIAYNSGSEIEASRIEPGWSVTKTFTVKNNATFEQTYNISWKDVENTFINTTDLVFSIDGEFDERMAPLTDSGILLDVTIAGGETHSYELTLTYKNHDSINQSLDKNSKFSGSIKIIVNETDEIREETLANLEELNEVVTKQYNKEYEKNYPIGSILISSNTLSPEEYLNFGTWELVGNGKTIVGVDEEDTDFDEVEKIGGSKYLQAHTHVAPAHTHTVPNHTHTWSGTTNSAGSHTHSLTLAMQISTVEASGYGLAVNGPFTNRAIVTGSQIVANSAGAHAHTVTGATSSNGSGNTAASGTGATGSTGAGSSGNLQPYYTTYIWKRVS